MDLTGNSKSYTLSTMGSGIKHHYKLVANAGSVITLPSDYDSEGDVQVFHVPHPFLIIQSPSSPETSYYGIERAYNETKGTDVLSAITLINGEYISFDPTRVSDGDVIDIILYTTYASMKAGEPVRREWVEAYYRQASQLDRIDWGNYTPPFEWSKDQSNYSDLSWAYHQRLFYSFSGWNHVDDRYSDTVKSCGPLTKGQQTILQWAPNTSNIVGMFVGDPAMSEISGANTKFAIQPVPFYITGMTFFCAMKNTTFDPTKGAAVHLDVTLDGVNDTMSSSPGYEDEDDVREITAKFGDDNSLYLSFSSNLDYGGLTPAYKYGRAINSVDYNIIHKRLFTRATAITVTANLTGEDTDWETLDEWYLTFSGFIVSGGDY